MGAGIVIVFWGIFLGVCGIVWLALVGLAFLGWKWKKAWLKWGAGLPAALFLALGLVIGGLAVYGLARSMNPRSVFKDTFGIVPSAGISEVRSDVYWFADTGSVFLRFVATEEEFRKLIPDGLKESTMEAMRDEFPIYREGEGPTWWPKHFQSHWLCFLRKTAPGTKPGRKGFYSETEYLIYDRTNKTAYYRFIGID